MKLLFFLIFIVITAFSFSACEKQVEGCMHPRAKNFNPGADKDKGCDFYELQLQIQHYADPMPNDTFVLGNWLVDADGQFFYLNNFVLLASKMHLFRANSQEEVTSPELISLFDAGGAITEVEDNFFMTTPGNYSYDIAGWNELGVYDSLRFYVGLPNSIKNSNPSRVAELRHPLSTSAYYYMYDSVSTSYQSCVMVVKQVSSGNTINVQSFDYIPISLPCNITVVDGFDIPIRLRLDYVKLFNGISFSNDTPTQIKDKMTQNFQTAFSIY